MPPPTTRHFLSFISTNIGKYDINLPNSFFFQLQKSRKSILTYESSFTTNLLFFNRDPKGTKEIWFYELELPDGLARFTKTNPIKNYHFNNLRNWWNNRVENEQAWLVKVEDIENYNLDLKNPSKIDVSDSYTIDEILDKMKEITKENSDILSRLEGMLK